MSIDKYTKTENADGVITLAPKAEDLDWVPKGGERYYYMSASGGSGSWKYCDDASDRQTIKNHNAFKTEALAEKASKLQRVSNAIIRACLLVDPDYEPEWGENARDKHSVYYANVSGGWKTTVSTSCVFSIAHVSTQKKAEQVAALLTKWNVSP